MFTNLWNLFCGPPRPGTEPQKPILKEETERRSPEELKKDLTSENWSDRSSAITEISAGGYKEFISDLRKILKEDPNPIVKATSAVALGEFQDKESTPEIVSLLKNESIPKDAVIDSLRRMKDARGAGAIVKYLDEKDNSMRLQVVEALKEIGNKSVGRDILQMAEKNTDEEKAKTYAMALGKLEIKEAENYLIQIAKSAEPSPTLAAALLAMGRIQSKKSIPILTEAIGKDFPKGRENSVESLILIKDKSCLPLLYPYLENKSFDIRYASAAVIGEIPDSKTQTILEKILSGKESLFYGAASYTAGRLKLESLRAKIEEILVKKEFPERETIAQSLGWIGNKKSVPILIQVLEEKDGEGRYGAAWSLGVLEAVEAFDALVRATSSSDKKLVALALESIGQLKLEKGVDVLEKAIREDKNMALFAMSSISVIPGNKARKSLEAFAISDDPPIYRPAIEFLGKRKEKESIPVLIEILKKGNGEKNRITMSALVAITGKKISTSSGWIEEYK